MFLNCCKSKQKNEGETLKIFSSDSKRPKTKNPAKAGYETETKNRLKFYAEYRSNRNGKPTFEGNIIVGSGPNGCVDHLGFIVMSAEKNAHLTFKTVA